MWISRSTWDTVWVMLRHQQRIINELRAEGERQRMVMDDLRAAIDQLIADFAAAKGGTQAAVDAAVAAATAAMEAKAQAALDAINAANPPA